MFEKLSKESSGNLFVKLFKELSVSMPEKFYR